MEVMPVAYAEEYSSGSIKGSVQRDPKATRDLGSIIDYLKKLRNS